MGVIGTCETLGRIQALNIAIINYLNINEFQRVDEVPIYFSMAPVFSMYETAMNELYLGNFVFFSAILLSGLRDSDLVIQT